MNTKRSTLQPYPTQNNNFSPIRLSSNNNKKSEIVNYFTHSSYNSNQIKTTLSPARIIPTTIQPIQTAQFIIQENPQPSVQYVVDKKISVHQPKLHPSPQRIIQMPSFDQSPRIQEPSNCVAYSVFSKIQLALDEEIRNKQIIQQQFEHQIQEIKNGYEYKISQMANEITRLQQASINIAQFQEINSQLNYYKTEYVQISQFYNQNLNEIEKVQSDLLYLNKDLEMQKGAINQKDDEIAKYQDKIAQMELAWKKRLEDIKNQYEKFRNQENQRIENSCLNQFNNEKAQLEAFIHQLQQKIQEELNEKQQLTNYLEISQKKYDELENFIQQIQQQKEKEMNDLANQMNEKIQETHQYKLRLQEACQRIVDMEENSQYSQNKISARIGEIENQFREARELLQNQLDELKNEKMTLVQQINFYQQSIQSYEEEKNDLNSTIANQKNLIYETERQKLQCLEQLKQFQDGQGQVQQQLKSAYFTIEQYKSTELEYESTVKQLKQTFSQLQSKNNQLTDINKELENKIIILEQQIDKLKKQIYNSENEFGQSREQLLSDLKQLESQYKALKNKYNELDQIKVSIENNYTSINNEMQNVSKMNYNFKQKIQDLENQISSFSIEKQQLNSQFNSKFTNSQNQITSLQRENQSLTQEIQAWKGKYNDLENQYQIEIDELTSQIETYNSYKISSNEEQIKFNSIKSQLESEINNLRNKLRDAEAKINSISTENRRLESRCQDILQECESWKNQFKNIEKNLEDYEINKRKLEQIKTDYMDLQQENLKVKSEKQSSLKSIERLEMDLQLKQKELDSTYDLIKQRRSETESAQRDLEQSKKEMLRIQSQFQEKETAIRLCQEEINQLRNQIADNKDTIDKLQKLLSQQQEASKIRNQEFDEKIKELESIKQQYNQQIGDHKRQSIEGKTVYRQSIIRSSFNQNQ